MEKVLLKAELRTIIGKKVKNLRLAGKVPAVIYGSEVKSLPITLDKKDTTNTLNKFSKNVFRRITRLEIANNCSLSSSIFNKIFNYLMSACIS